MVRNLMLRDKEKGLSTGERKMLNNANKSVSELVLVNNMDEDEIESMIEGIITKRLQRALIFTPLGKRRPAEEWAELTYFLRFVLQVAITGYKINISGNTQRRR